MSAFDVTDQIRQLPYQITCIDTFSCQLGGRGSPATSDHWCWFEPTHVPYAYLAQFIV